MQAQKLTKNGENSDQNRPSLSQAKLSDSDIAALFLDIVPSAMQDVRSEMRRARTTELSVAQFRVLANLWCEPVNNRMLAETLGLSVAATSRMVDWLIRHGLAEKAQHPVDRRQIVVQLTPLGKRTFETSQKQTRLRFEKRIQNLSAGAKQNLAQGLVALKLAMKELV